MIPVTRSSMPPYEEYCNEIQDLWDSRWLTNMGEKHEALRAELERYLGVDHVELLVNGHMAIELSLQALDLHGEVITTPFTFASTTHAIVRSGLTPVFCDVDPVTFTMDPSKIEPLLTERTCALLPVHVYGNVCQVEAIEEIARRYNLKVIYDAAHAFGVRYHGRGIGAFGDVSCFSFHATKVFHTIEGGAACFRDETFGKKLSLIRNFGISGPEEVEGAGANAKLNEFCAAMGLCNLRHAADERKKRGRIVARYRDRLEGTAGLRLGPAQEDVEPNYSYFPVIVDEKRFGTGRDAVFSALAKKDIRARKYFYPLTNTFPYVRGGNSGSTPVARWLSERVLTLPLYADMRREEVDAVCDAVLSCRMGGTP